jgi:protein phosphatase 1G
MQGWRNTMEDSHICMTNLGDNCSLFGVFDGHGGNQYLPSKFIYYSKHSDL